MLGCNTRVFRFALGGLKAAIIDDGYAFLPAYPLFAANADPADVAAAVAEQGLNNELLRIHNNVLIVETSRGRVLVDTGNGVFPGWDSGHLSAGLAELGIAPSAIDHVILTHCHFDHTNGLFNSDGTVAFENATVHISDVEHALWTDQHVDLSGMIAPEELKVELIATAKRQLAALGDRIQLFRFGETEILPNFFAVPAPGHTPGQVAILASSDNYNVLQTADVMHSPTVNLEHPEWQPGADMEPDVATATRRHLLDRALADDLKLLPYHFPWPAIGSPRTFGEKLAWQPMLWQS